MHSFTNPSPLLPRSYIDYKTKNWPSKERDAAFQPLHEKYSPMALDIILQLRGFYIKIGQIGVGIGDLMPKEYIDTLSSLQVKRGRWGWGLPTPHHLWRLAAGRCAARVHRLCQGGHFSIAWAAGRRDFFRD